MFKFLAITLLFALKLHAAEVTPTARLLQSLEFVDDMSFQGLDQAIDRQLVSYGTRPMKGTIRFGGVNYPKSILKDSLILLKALTKEAAACLDIQNGSETCLEDFNRKINERFSIYRPTPGKKEPGFRQKSGTKFTSYYSPDLTGSRVQSEKYRNPIYRTPDQASEQKLSRVDIDFKSRLSGKGYEIFYVEDSLFDLYLLHVQGGGRIKIHNPDGTHDVKYLSYSSANGQSFQMIYKYMLQKGYLKPNQASVPEQRRFMEENPDKQEEIFRSSPSYIFFKETAEEPLGLDNIPLTEGRSLAMDRNIYKTTGIINFVKTVKASHVDANGKVVKVPFSRFFIGQDTGGAILGNARCDLYFGYGPLAELTAYNMNEMGEQYFLVKKN